MVQEEKKLLFLNQEKHPHPVCWLAGLKIGINSQQPSALVPGWDIAIASLTKVQRAGCLLSNTAIAESSLTLEIIFHILNKYKDIGLYRLSKNF